MLVAFTIGVTLICLALVAALIYVTREAAKERAALYQRIQAPERAVAQYDREQRPERPPARVIPADDDDAMRQAIEERTAG